MKYRVEEQNTSLIHALGHPTTVLDVGCGIGLNGQIAKQKGAHVTGIEIVPSSAKQAQQVLDEVLSINIESDEEVKSALFNRTFEVILFADVLEHVKDPLSVIQRFLPYLTEEGRVIVSVPNIAAWTVRLELLLGEFNYEPSGILDDSHLRFFTKKTIAALLTNAGLSILYEDLNPHLTRAAKKFIAQAYSLQTNTDATRVARSFPYKLYQQFIRPVEHQIAQTMPNLLAFQHIVIARKSPARRRMSLTIGMLTMNEEESITQMIDEIRQVAPDAQILCIDSSTKDRTAEIARSLGAQVIRQVPPRGHGPAMELLMTTAAKQSDLLIYLDCDFTYPTKMIPIVRELLEQRGVDVVNCARTRTKPEAMPWPNYIANRSFAKMAHWLHGVPTCDVHSGMRGYKTSVIRSIDFDGEGDALPIDTLLLPAKRGYRVLEIDIDYHERVGTSKLRKVAGTAWTFVRLARMLSVGSRRAPHFQTM